MVLKIIEAGLAARDKLQIGLKWPLASAKIKIEEELDEIFYELIKSQLNVKKIIFRSGKELEIELDSKMNLELEAEGYAREISRNIQAFRKTLGLEKQDKIHLYIFSDDKFIKILEKNKSFISERTNSEKLEFFSEEPKETFKNINEFKIKDKRGKLVIITTN